MKFVHAADLHLDSPLRGLTRYEGAPVERIRLATRQAFENLVDLCLEEDAELLLLAGDVFDGDWRDYATGLFFVGQLNRLRESDTRVVLLHGNHDAASPITRDLELPKHIHLLSSKQPETLEFGECAVHGQSFQKREVLTDLAATYPAPVAGALNIGLLHTALTGRPDHAPYAPTRLEVLQDRGYQYWALGHVHTREVLAEDPYIVFPGNLQGRNIRETGAKGATLATRSGTEIIQLEHRPLDVVRWQRVGVEVASKRDSLGLLDQIRAALEDAWAEAEDRLLVARIEMHGSGGLPEAQRQDSFEHNLRLLAGEVGDVWIEKIVWNLKPLDVADPDDADPNDTGAMHSDAITGLLRHIEEAKSDDAVLKGLGNTFEELTRKLPREAREGMDSVRPEDPEYMVRALDRVAQSLVPELQPEAGASSDARGVKASR